MRSGVYATSLCMGVMACLVLVVRSESEPNAYAPELDMKDTDGEAVKIYRGFIVSDEDFVVLNPELKATDKDETGGARFICGYRLTPEEGKDYDIPFEVEVIDHFDGRAKLRLKAGASVDPSKRKKHKFQISAYDCGSPTLHSKKAHVVVRVLEGVVGTDSLVDKLDMKTPPIPAGFDPTDEPEIVSPPAPPKPDFSDPKFFERSSYIVAIHEATLYDSILTVRPADMSHMASICSFEIQSEQVPFTVDTQGNIKNTEQLDVKHQTNYILPVVANSCDGETSTPVMVNVQVSELCRNGWKEVPEKQDYRAGTKAIYPFIDAYFDTCADSCEIQDDLEVTITLDSKGEINTCQHDTFSIQSQRQSCGASESTVDLLPKGEVWTDVLENLESQDAAYKFDGKTAVNVPSSHSNHTLGDHFGLSMWMRHGEEKMDGHKEHVLCNSDGDKMNRHHYALFVHNCRLVFLLRKEASQVDDLNKFTPAEWRYSIPHVCDDQWHHYTLSVNYPEVKLYVDGQQIQKSDDVVEIVDDWALHPTNKVHFDQLTVGACWQGSTSDYGQYLNGYLAGVSMLAGSTETDRVIKCMNNCGEKLQFHAMDLLETGMSVSFNTELTEFTVRGSDPEEVKKILRKVGYSNTNGELKPEVRRLHVHTNATCNGKQLSVNEQIIPVFVQAISDPKIHIDGVSHKMRRPDEFASGVDLFTELLIVSDLETNLAKSENAINKLMVEDVSTMQKELKTRLLLDRCEVRVEPALNPETETLHLPSQLLVEYLIDSKEFDDGFDLSGSENFARYEMVLKEVFYKNKAVDDSFTTKNFEVRCFDMNGRFESNLFTLDVGLLTDTQEQYSLYSDPAYNHAKQAVQSVNEAEAAFNQGTATSGSSAATVAVVIVCVLFLVAIIGVAVFKIRSVNRRRNGSSNVHVEDGPTLEWDDTTLNITVNPLESDTLMAQAKEEEFEVEEDELMSSDEEEGGDNYEERNLEWDNSTLSY